MRYVWCEVCVVWGVCMCACGVCVQCVCVWCVCARVWCVCVRCAMCELLLDKHQERGLDLTCTKHGHRETRAHREAMFTYIAQ